MPDHRSSPTGGVQALERALSLLDAIGAAGGTATVSQLAASSGLPLPTIHRLLRTMVTQGYLRQDPSREYSLGPRLLRLAETTSRLLASWARPHLAALAVELGESANLAALDGDEVLYLAQSPSPHSMRMFTETGRKVPAHATGAGKVLLAQLPDERVAAALDRAGMPASTPHTITDQSAFLASLSRVRAAGFAVDLEEQELGVKCIAVPVPNSPVPLAMSVSGPAVRMDEAFQEQAVHRLLAAARAFSAEL